jgi:hypothetical protein
MPTIQTITNPSGAFPYVPTSRTLTINGVSYDLTADRSWTISTSGTGTVTSVALSATMPTGLVASISGSPITSNGTLGLTVTMQSGYSIPTTAKQLQWDAAFTFSSSFPVGTTGQLVRFLSTGSLEAFTPNYMGNPMTSLGDMIYGNAVGIPLRLAPNTTTTKKFLAMTGDGTNGDQPFWDTITGFIGGSGTTGYIPKFTASGTIGNSIITESSGVATINGVGQVYNQQAGAGSTVMFISNQDTTAAINHQTRIITQSLGSGLGKTTILAASNTTGTTRGQFDITNEAGTSFILQLGTSVTSSDYAMSLYTTGGVEGIRLNTNGVSYLNGGNLLVGSTTNISEKLQVTGNILLAAGSDRYIKIGSSTNYYYNLQSTGDNFQIIENGTTPRLTVKYPNGQLQLNAYTNVMTFSGTILGLLAFDSSGNVITRNNVVDLTLSTTGNNGSATYNTVTGALNIPTYTLDGLGGMGNPMTSLGDMIYGNAVGIPLRVPANTTTTKKFLSMTGDGTNGDQPFWDTITASSIGALSSVGIAIPTGFSVSNSPLTSNGTITISFASGYSLPTNSKQSEWDSAYTNRITNLTTTGNSGSASLISNTLNIPTYTLDGLGGMGNPMTSLGDMIYGNAVGIPLRVAANTTTTKKYLAMTGDGTSGDQPFWDAISGITGSGTTNYVAKFTPSGTAVGNSLIYDNGTNVGIGATSLSGKLHVQAATGGTSLYLTDSVNSSFYITHPSTARTSFFNGSATRWLTEFGGDVGFENKVIVGGSTPLAQFHVKGGTLATSGTGLMVAAEITNGRLETYQSSTCQAIHTYFDSHSYEISAGSTSGYVSGLVITGRGATLLPDRVAIYTRSAQRLQINGSGQLNLTNYNSATSFTGTPVAYLACDSVGNIITSNPSGIAKYMSVAFNTVGNTWLDMPSALSFFDSSNTYVTQLELSSFNQVRLVVNKLGTAGATGSKLILRYQDTTGAPFTASSYSDIGTSEVSVTVDVANNILVSSWINLATAAKDDVWVALLGVDGDGAIDPTFGNIYAEFRYNP